MLHYLVCFFLVFPFVVVVLSLLRGKPTLKVAPNAIAKQHHFACIITAYKQYDIALPLYRIAASANAQQPKHLLSCRCLYRCCIKHHRFAGAFVVSANTT